MLTRFRNALYGSPSSSDDTAVVLDRDNRENVIDKKIRNALTRSSSFREELLNGAMRSRNNTLKSADRVHLKDEYDTSQYSQHSMKPNHTSSASGLKLPKHPYQRPEFLNLRTEDEILVSADHSIRPIILPRDVSRLPWNTGYAECINAGKSIRNEDQAACHQGLAFNQNELNTDELPVPIYETIPWTYFAIFDGHAGPAVAITAANMLHLILAEKLNEITDHIVKMKFRSHDKNLYENMKREKRQQYEQQEQQTQQQEELDETKSSSDEPDDSPPTLRPELTTCKEIPRDSDDSDGGFAVDTLIKGAMESAFLEMDAQIGDDKREYRMPGGCTAIASLFILGKLYVCNAGDSRAMVYLHDESRSMSNDFTPITDKKRIVRLAQLCPKLLCDTFTQIDYHPRHPRKSDLGTRMLYRNAYMTGFALKTISHEDLKYPLISGEGKRSRLLATIGVTRGFGDHEMRSQYGSVPIKPFLTAEPEISILDLENDNELTANDVLIIGTDGLWDVTSCEKAGKIIEKSFSRTNFDNETSRLKYRYMTAAQDLILSSRGLSTGFTMWYNRLDDTIGSHDDISAFVIPLKPYQLEYEQWKQTRTEALMKKFELLDNTNIGNKNSTSSSGGETSNSTNGVAEGNGNPAAESCESSCPMEQTVNQQQVN